MNGSIAKLKSAGKKRGVYYNKYTPQLKENVRNKIILGLVENLTLLTKLLTQIAFLFEEKGYS